MEKCLHFKKCWTESHFHVKEVTNTMKLRPVTTLGEFLFLTLQPDVFAEYFWRQFSGEEVFAFIAAAAAGRGNDDHQKENCVQETIEPVTKKQRNHPESHHTEAEVSKK